MGTGVGAVVGGALVGGAVGATVGFVVGTGVAPGGTVVGVVGVGVGFGAGVPGAAVAVAAATGVAVSPPPPTTGVGVDAGTAPLVGTGVPAVVVRPGAGVDVPRGVAPGFDADGASPVPDGGVVAVAPAAVVEAGWGTPAAFVDVPPPEELLDEFAAAVEPALGVTGSRGVAEAIVIGAPPAGIAGARTVIALPGLRRPVNPASSHSAAAMLAGDSRGSRRGCASRP